MPILIKLLQAIVLGIIMVFSVMLLAVFTFAIIGFIAQMFNLSAIAEKMYKLQQDMWLRIKKWFFRYRELNDK